jgi:hypothetical protein
MSLNVGELVGYLRLDMGDFETGMAKGQALADKLDGKNVDVKVDADTGVAEAKLAGVAASEAKVDDGNKKIAKSGNDAGKGMGALVTAVLLLGPALVPIAAGAAGLAVGFGAMGLAGVLAIVGINQEMKAGTPLGGAYSAMLGTLKGDLTTLGRTAASGTLAPFQQAVGDLQQRMPVLNTIVGQFSVITGKTAGVLTTGLVAAFIALAPLARDAGVYILNLSTRFAELMSGPGVVTFGDYVRSVFPQVMQAVESIVTAALRLVAALAPLGLGTLTILRVFTDVINALPVDVLSNLATVAASVYIGFKAYGMLSVGVTALGTALEFVGVSAETAATGLAIMNIAAGAIAAVLAIAVFAFTANANATRENQQAINDYTDALVRSNGAIDANIREMAFKKLTDSGAIDDAKALGLNLSLVTDAMLGNVPASRAVGAQMAAMVANTALSSSAALVQSGHINALSTVLGTSTSQFGSATQAQKDHAAAMATSAGTTGALTTATLVRMTAAQQAASTDKSQVAAIKALNTAMDEELSRALSLAGATSGVDQAVLNMTTALKANKGSLNEHTQAGISDRQAIEAVAGSLQSQRDAQIKAGASTADATGKYQTASAALLVQTGKIFGTTSAAYLYEKQLLAIPPSVKTTIGVNVGAAVAAVSSLQGYLDRLHGKNITLTVTQQGSANKLLGMGPPGGAAGRLIGRAGGGGLLVGPGTSTSDSITGVDASGTPIVRVSRDEFVVNAAAYAKNKALVNAINDGQQPGQSGPRSSYGGPMVQVTVERVVQGTPHDIGHEVAWAMAGKGA